MELCKTIFCSYKLKRIFYNRQQFYAKWHNNSTQRVLLLIINQHPKSLPTSFSCVNCNSPSIWIWASHWTSAAHGWLLAITSSSSLIVVPSLLGPAVGVGVASASIASTSITATTAALVIASTASLVAYTEW